MVNWILSSSLLILAVLGIRAVLKEKISQRLRYALWLLVLLRLLIPGSIGQSRISAANLTGAIQGRYNPSPAVQTQTITPPESPALEIPEGDTADTHSSGLPLPKLAKGIWILGAMAVGCVFLFSNLRFGLGLRRSSRGIRGVRRGLPIRVSEAASSPCLFGLFRPTIYVTPAVAEEPTLLRHCVCHERCHYRHGDHIWSVLRGVCAALHWYNPLVWWAAVLSRRDSELACDEAAIRTLGERERAEYGRTLILMTCKSSGSVLLAATTMSSKKSVIRERIRMIARKPKTAVLALIALILIGALAAGCAFTGARLPDPEETDAAAVPSAEDTRAAAEPETIPSSSMTLQKEREADKVCIAVLPTGISFAGGDFRYIIPENQQLWRSAYQRAVDNVSEDLGWDGSSGYSICYGDAWWEVTESGALLGVGSVSPENGAELVALCRASLADAGINPPASLEDFTAIRGASLDWNGSHSLSDPADLRKIENWLTRSTQIRGAGCWFTGMLTLELENGETRTIAMATDSCGTWMSEGVCYQYAGGNEEFYSLFAAEAIHDAARQGMGSAMELMIYMDWSRYANHYGQEETLALMEQLKAWALENPKERCFSPCGSMRGLDGAYADYYAGILSQLYEADKPEFAWQCLGNAPDNVREEVLSLLAHQWGISQAEARARLQQQLDG